MIAPVFESLSAKYSKPKKITFCKIDVDSQGEVAQLYGVRAMPTFLVLHNGSVINTIKGANPPALTAAVDAAVKLAGPGAAPGAVFTTAGKRLGGSGVPASRQSLARPMMWDVKNIINAITSFIGLYLVSLLSNRCPGCRAQLLGFYDALLSPRSRIAASPFSRPGAGAVSAAHRRPSRLGAAGTPRHFSSTKSTLQDAPKHKEVVFKAEDAETIVRQARQTFGNTLPPDYLTGEEYRLYERLYGPPLRETRPEDVGIPYHGESGGITDSTQRTLLRKTEDGELEEVEYTIDASPAAEEDQQPVEVSDDIDGIDQLPPLTNAQADYLNVTANNQREYYALMKLQQDFEAASIRPLEEIEEEEVAEEEEPEEDNLAEEEESYGREREHDDAFGEYVESTQRLHTNTILGEGGTNPSTIFLPKDTFVHPVIELLRRTDIEHVKEAAERVFGGPGLPHSPATPLSKKGVPQKGIQLQAVHQRMSEIEADAFISTVLPGVYASATHILVETRKRLGADWLKGLLTKADGKGPRVLDVGSGGAGLLAWQEIASAEWDVLKEKGAVTGHEPHGKKTVVVGSDHLRHRISRFLHDTTFIPRLPDYLHSVEGSERQLDSNQEPAPRKTFDVIIASHLLMNMERPWKRQQLLDNLWAMLSPEGGVLIVLEKGHPRGFEAVADVRQRLLDEFIIPPSESHEPRPEEITPLAPARVREPGMIIAPCTTHHKCPMYLTPGLSAGRKDYCRFSQRFIRPPFLQRIMGGSHRNHEDIEFSYISEALARSAQGFYNAEDPEFHPLSLPRILSCPLKRHGHVVMDMCTPAGDVERWVIPRSFGKQAYHDARKAQWADLWALGTKTRTHRTVRLGKANRGDDGQAAVPPPKDPNDGGVRSRLMAQGGRRKLKVVDVDLDPNRGVVGTSERVSGRERVVERRTKGGKKVRIKDLLEDMGIDQVRDDDEHEYEEEVIGAIRRKEERKKKKDKERGEREDEEKDQW
ncbi:mitochondrial small ribosomal subunit Rsm22-domain-containing protein [Bombardia bombarda]|uniref:Mitochondrial small ribosomal subunit Rsm22-domain-containing protein n=1 Tax=Bombardia bombarda TaxID=252184 RepID=A0AA39X6X0_9PEZI|nr:mitochondrial small ribosomal subunit Rsm22-domain-containing protein [Bombardia bombarda]